MKPYKVTITVDERDECLYHYKVYLTNELENCMEIVDVLLRTLPDELPETYINAAARKALAKYRFSSPVTYIPKKNQPFGWEESPA